MGAADRERFVREEIPAAVYEVYVERARTLRLRAFAAAFARIRTLGDFLGSRARCVDHERSVWSTKNGHNNTTHKSALARTTLSGLTGP